MKNTNRTIVLLYVCLLLLVCIGLLFYYKFSSRTEQAQPTLKHTGNKHQAETSKKTPFPSIDQRGAIAGQTMTMPQVHIAGKDCPVEFEDASISVTDRQRIIADFSVFLSLASSFDKLKGREVKAGVFRPVVLPLEEQDGIFLLDDNDKKNIQINSVFSDKYLNAFALTDVHSNAIQQVKDFVALMNDPNLPSKSMPILRDVCRFGRSLDEQDNVATLSDADVQAVVTEMQNEKYLGFSALYFGVGKSTQIDNVELPQLIVLTTGKNTKDPLDFGGYLIEFHNGKWIRGWLP